MAAQLLTCQVNDGGAPTEGGEAATNLDRVGRLPSHVDLSRLAVCAYADKARCYGHYQWLRSTGTFRETVPRVRPAGTNARL